MRSTGHPILFGNTSETGVFGPPRNDRSKRWASVLNGGLVENGVLGTFPVAVKLDFGGLHLTLPKATSGDEGLV